MGWRELREIDCDLVSSAGFRNLGEERVVPLNRVRNSPLDVGFAVRQVFFEVRNIFSKDFVAKATTHTGPSNSVVGQLKSAPF